MKKAARSASVGVVLLIGAFASSGPASASATRCYPWALTKDVQGSICLEISGTKLHTSSIVGTYDGIPTSNTMQLYINGRIVEQWHFQHSDIQHRFKTGLNRNWPAGTTTVKYCLPFVYGVGHPCAQATIHR